MIQLPDSLSWRFDEIKKIEPDRADLLENAPSSDAIVEELAKFFEDALQQKKMNFGWEQANKSPEDARVVLQFQISQRLFDYFFNSRSGYRAHFWASGKFGTQFNYKIIAQFCDQIEIALPNTISVRKLNSNYDDLGTIDIAKSFLIKSLNSNLSKIWACTKLIRVGGGSKDLPTGVTGSKLIVGSEKFWPEIYRDTDDTWLDVKGAFCAKKELYQIKTLGEREEGLHNNGEA